MNSRRLQPAEHEKSLSALVKFVFLPNLVKKKFWLKPIRCLISPPAEAGGYSKSNYNVNYLFKIHQSAVKRIKFWSSVGTIYFRYLREKYFFPMGLKIFFGFRRIKIRRYQYFVANATFKRNLKTATSIAIQKGFF